MRPKIGSVSSCLESSEAAIAGFERSMSGASPVTVMLSATVPTSIVKSDVRNCCVPTRRPLRSSVLNPCIATFNEYVAGRTFANEYSPTSLVVVTRVALVSSLVSVISAPGMTPFASLISPRTPP